MEVLEDLVVEELLVVLVAIEYICLKKIKIILKILHSDTGFS